MFLDEKIKRTSIATANPIAEEFPFCVNVQKPFGQLDRVLSWCRHDCTNGTWGWRMETMPSVDRCGMYKFYFIRETDAVAFALRWADH